MKKKTKKSTTKTKTTRKTANLISAAPRKCSVCGKRGHNARSHDPGGRLAYK